jgi:hypothetical protein
MFDYTLRNVLNIAPLKYLQIWENAVFVNLLSSTALSFFIGKLNLHALKWNKMLCMHQSDVHCWVYPSISNTFPLSSKIVWCYIEYKNLTASEHSNYGKKCNFGHSILQCITTATIDWVIVYNVTWLLDYKWIDSLQLQLQLQLI